VCNTLPEGARGPRMYYAAAGSELITGPASAGSSNHASMPRGSISPGSGRLSCWVTLPGSPAVPQF